MGISPLPRRVKFKGYRGHVIDEVWIQEDFDDLDYRFFIQQIRWDDGEESIRIAYYTRPHGTDDTQWGFANRAPNIYPENLRELIRRAMQRNLFHL